MMFYKICQQRRLRLKISHTYIIDIPTIRYTFLLCSTRYMCYFVFENYNERVVYTKHIIYACFGDSRRRRYNADHDEHYMGYGLMGYVRDNSLL